MRTQSFARNVVVAIVMAIALVIGAPGATRAQPSPDDGPFETYAAYLAALQSARTIEDLAPWLAASSRAMIDETPADERPMLFGMLQAMGANLKDVELSGVTVDGAKASLDVTASLDSSAMAGTIKLVREDGAWRIESEGWRGGM